MDVIYFLFIISIQKKNLQQAPAGTLKPLGFLFLLHVVLHVMMGLSIIDFGGGETSSVYTHDSKRIIRDVEKFEKHVVDYGGIEGIEDHFLMNRYKGILKNSDFRVEG